MTSEEKRAFEARLKRLESMTKEHSDLLGALLPEYELRKIEAERIGPVMETEPDSEANLPAYLRRRGAGGAAAGKKIA